MCSVCIAYKNLIEEFGNDRKAVRYYEMELKKVKENES